MSDRIGRIVERLAPLRQSLLNHEVYREMDRLASLQTFMEYHVFAVWDFMSLLKTLQQRLCCVESPWLPPRNSLLCRFLNEIVLAEESDDDGSGGYASHFDLYHRAMRQCGADTSGIDGFLNRLREGISIQAALELPGVSKPAREFVCQTFNIIDEGQVCAIASAFTFGREDLLPDVFQRIVDQLNSASGGKLDDFQYYLERHIGLDGDEHGPMATRLVESLCGSDDSLWSIAEQAAVDSLKARLKLWDGIYDAVCRLSLSTTG